MLARVASLRALALTPDACGYQKSGGICNDTIIGYPFTPFAQLIADAPSKPVDYKKITSTIIPKTAEAFRDDNWNQGLSRAGSVLIFVSPDYGGSGLLSSPCDGLLGEIAPRPM